MQGLPANVWILFSAQALNICASFLVLLLGGIIGSQLAPSPALATMPVALMVVGTAGSVVFASLASARWGRKPVFFAGIGIATAGASLCALALQAADFSLFCAGTFLMGCALAIVQQYRFAAMESVSAGQVPAAASRILLAGLLAAFIGPELAVRGKDLFATAYVGSFLGTILLSLLAALVLLAYRPAAIAQKHDRQNAQPWRLLLRRPVLWVAVLGAAVGYAVMTFVMTATPLSMHLHAGHDLVQTKQVIQSHIFAMFLPSLVSGWLMSQFGVGRIMFVGCLMLLGAVFAGLSGLSVAHYWVALVLLGVGWNFLFVGGTALLPRASGDEAPYRAQALNEFMVFGCQALASLSAGWVLAQLGWDLLLYLCIPLIGLQLGMFVYWRWRKTEQA